MSWMFYGCMSLTSISAINNWYTSDNVFMNKIFNGCDCLNEKRVEEFLFYHDQK